MERTTSITSKGQVTIPLEIRRMLGLKPHDKVTFVLEGQQVRLTPAKSVVAQTAGLLKSNAPMLSPHDEKVAAEEAMAEEADKNEGS